MSLQFFFFELSLLSDDYFGYIIFIAPKSTTANIVHNGVLIKYDNHTIFLTLYCSPSLIPSNEKKIDLK
jgi:hypothetical protein